MAILDEAMSLTDRRALGISNDRLDRENGGDDTIATIDSCVKECIEIGIGCSVCVTVLNETSSLTNGWALSVSSKRFDSEDGGDNTIATSDRGIEECIKISIGSSICMAILNVTSTLADRWALGISGKGRDCKNGGHDTVAAIDSGIGECVDVGVGSSISMAVFDKASAAANSIILCKCRSRFDSQVSNDYTVAAICRSVEKSILIGIASSIGVAILNKTVTMTYSVILSMRRKWLGGNDYVTAGV